MRHIQTSCTAEASRCISIGLASLSMVVTGPFLVACDSTVATDEPRDQRISLTLIAPPVEGAKSVDVLVPLSYIGPSALPTSVRNARGGEHSKLLIEFLYPSMEAVAGKGSRSTELELYAEVVSATPNGTRSYAEFELSLLKGSFQRSQGNVCELEEYKSNTILGSGGRRHHAWIYYYYKDQQDATSDVYVHCGDKASGDPKCRYHFDTEGGLSVLLHLVPRSQLCQWREITTRVSSQIDGFVAQVR